MCKAMHTMEGKRIDSHLQIDTDGVWRTMDMAEDKTEERVLRVVSVRYDSLVKEESKTKITMDTDIRRDLGFDSITLVVLQIELEDEFHIRFNPAEDDLEKIFTTVQVISDYIKDMLRDEYGQQ